MQHVVQPGRGRRATVLAVERRQRYRASVHHLIRKLLQKTRRFGVRGSVCASLLGCAAEEDRGLPATNDEFETPATSSDETVGDEVAVGRGRSRLSLGPLANREMRVPLVQVYQPAASEWPERLYLSYSIVLADGDALSVVLPYAGNDTTIDAASLRFGDEGLLWSSHGNDMFSTRGSFRIEAATQGMAVHVHELIMANPLQTGDSMALGDGMIEGQLERRCLLATPNPDGLIGPNGEPAIHFEIDTSWTSDFCAEYR